MVASAWELDESPDKVADKAFDKFKDEDERRLLLEFDYFLSRNGYDQTWGEFVRFMMMEFFTPSESAALLLTERRKEMGEQIYERMNDVMDQPHMYQHRPTKELAKRIQK